MHHPVLHRCRLLRQTLLIITLGLASSPIARGQLVTNSAFVPAGRERRQREWNRASSCSAGDRWRGSDPSCGSPAESREGSTYSAEPQVLIPTTVRKVLPVSISADFAP